MSPRGRKQPPGRPQLKPALRKRNNVTIRFRDDLKARLQKDGAAAGRSMSEEIEARVERSYFEEDALGGPQTYALFKAMAGAAK